MPVYDKSAFGGEGDRLPEEQWQVVSEEQARSVRVVLLEGWCVGYRALAEEDLQARWLAAQEGPPGSELAAQEWADVQMINTLLQDYEAAVSARLDAFVLLDCERLEWAYGWREEQEQRLREKSSGGGGKGMTEAQVVEFVRGYFPAYELYVEPLRRGRVVQREGANVRIVLDRERKVLSHSLV